MKSLAKGPSALITFKVPEDLRDDLDRECRSYGISRSALIRQILRTAINRARLEDAQ